MWNEPVALCQSPEGRNNGTSTEHARPHLTTTGRRGEAGPVVLLFCARTRASERTLGGVYTCWRIGEATEHLVRTHVRDLAPQHDSAREAVDLRPPGVVYSHLYIDDLRGRGFEPWRQAGERRKTERGRAKCLLLFARVGASALGVAPHFRRPGLPPPPPQPFTRCH